MKKFLFIIFLMVFLSLAACKKDEKFEITLETNGGSEIEVIDSKADLLEGIPVTTKPGYTFDGWFEDDLLTTPFDPLEDKDSWVFTLYAKWLPNERTYTIERYIENLQGTFILHEQSTDQALTGDTVSATIHAIEGFTYDEDNPNEIIQAVMPPVDNLTLKVYYIRNEYHVFIDENGGNQVSDLTKKYEETISGLPELERYGFIHTGWNTYPTEMPAHDVTIVATWEELPKYDIDFESNGGSLVDALWVYEDETIPKPVDPIREGYTFDGWYLEDSSEMFNFNDVLASEDLTLFAHWTPALVDYHVDIYIESLSGSYELYESILEEGLTESIVVANIEEIAGFSEYTLHPNRMISGEVLPDGSLTLSLYYSRNSYTISFEANANLSIQSITGQYEETVDEPADPIRTGYTFIGWYSDQNLTIPYVFQTIPYENITVYAKWQGNPSTLYFDAEGGVIVDPITAPVGDPIVEPTPSKEGYVFDGWYEEESLVTLFDEWLMPYGGITLYAKWIPDMYVISFEENGGTSVDNISAPYLSIVSAPSDPTKTDYLFMGWFEDELLTIPYTFTTMPLHGITVYAKWISEEEALNLSYIITLDPYTAVHVKGMVLVESDWPYQGFYITDGNANVYVIYDQDMVLPGESYAFDAVLIYQMGLPMFVSVSGLELISDEFTEVESLYNTFDEIQMLDNEIPYSYSIELTGILNEENNQLVIHNLDDGSILHITHHFSNTLLSGNIGEKVTIQAILSTYHNGWVLGVYDLIAISMTEEDKANMVKAYIDDQFETSYQGLDYIIFNVLDPWFMTEISVTLDPLDAIFYDNDHQRFNWVDTQEVINVLFEIDFYGTIYTHELAIDLLPRPFNTINDFYSGAIGDQFTVHGLIVMAHPEQQIFVLSGDNTQMFIEGNLPFNYGDEVVVEVTKQQLHNMVVGRIEEHAFFDYMSENNELLNDALEMSLETFSSLDPLDVSIYGQYVELRGFLDNSSMIEFHGLYQIVNELSQVEVEPITYQAYEALFDYVDLEVLIRGYIGENEDGEPMLFFTGQRLEIQIPEYTDLERVEMISTLFSRQYANHTFESYESFPLMPYHPVLGGTISWNFIEGEEHYDSFYQRFDFVYTEEEIEIEITITQNLITRTYLYQTTLVPPNILNIEQFKQQSPDSYQFVEGLVVYRDPYYIYLQDDTGLLTVESMDSNAYKGDYVVLYGRVYRDYEYPENVSLYYRKMSDDDTTIPLVVSIINRELPYEMMKHPMSLRTLTHQDPHDAASYNKMVTVKGYFEYGNYSFTLTMGKEKIEFTAVNEYINFQLAEYADTHVEISLMILEYDDGSFVVYYLGNPSDIGPANYTLEEKQEALTYWIIDVTVDPILSNETIGLPFEDLLLDATFTYEMPSEYDGILNLETMFISPVTEDMDIPLDVTITIGEVSIVHQTVVHVLSSVITDTVSISTAKTMVDQYVMIDAQVYATFNYDAMRYGLLVFDGNDFLIVIAPPYEYYYDGYEIGKIASLEGFVRFENERYILECVSYELTYDELDNMSPTPTSIESIATMNHAYDYYLGAYVEVTGRIERPTWGVYEIVTDHSRIRLQTVYYSDSTISRYVGFKVTLKGLILGKTTYDNSGQITLIVSDFMYDNQMYIDLNEASEQVVADKMLTDIMAGRYDEPYYAGDRIYIQKFHPLFNEAVATYTPLSHESLLTESFYELIVGMSSEDVYIDILVEVTCGTAVASEIFTVQIKAFSENTLDDLFDENVPFEEIHLIAQVVYSSFKFTYFIINNEIYYYDGTLGVYEMSGSYVLLIGKKSIIDGVVYYSYNVFYNSLQEEDYYELAPVETSIEDMYNANFSVNDIRRDYLTTYGKLGYDPFSNYFYLEDNGQRIYIRHDLEEAEAFSLNLSPNKDYMSKDQLMMYVDDYIFLNVLFPNKWVFTDYLLVDFVGDESDIMKPDWTEQEKLDIIKEKLTTRYHNRAYYSGDYLDLMTYDMVHEAEIEYTPEDPFQRAIWFDSWDMHALIVLTDTEIDVIASIIVYDELYNPYEDQVTLTITVKPLEQKTVKETLFGNIGQYYVTKGIIQYLYPEYFMIIKDQSGLIYVEIPGAEYLPASSHQIGDEVLILGMRAHFEFEDYVPVINQVMDIMVISTGHTVDPTAIQMTISDIIGLDYLDPMMFNQYIFFEGTVIFSGNMWYPSYDIREEGYLDNTYDLQMWGDDEDTFNATMNGLVGQRIRIYGYLIGYEYIYQAFDWHIKVTHYEIINE
ncbi:MAG: InlB B-repeat-containing protein [Acholeplasmataceae bacterium]|jgi:uncharacterized repeat protein (TIGR02543 family)|nr:InlB B-repeat-containing protein [Acholeplasmataceae bacterium]